MTCLINLTMILGTVADFQLINLRPIFDSGIIKDTIASIYSFSDITMAILAVGMLFPMLDNKKGVGVLSVSSMLLGAVLVLTWPFMETGVLGSDVMKQFVVVCMQQVRSAEITKYLPRYELIMVSFFKRIGQWFIGKSEEIEKLDEEIKSIINAQTERAFGFGFVLGIVLTVVIFKV
jgi:hypothetical protein